MDIRDIIYKIKGLAILSVVIAHTPIYVNSKVSQIISNLYSTIGAIGVPIFLFISGYLFNVKNLNIRSFLSKKINTVIIPWLFCSSIVYIISSYFGRGNEKINIMGYINFIFGNGSLFYYMSILFILYISMFYIVKSKITIYIVIALSSISIYLTASGVFANINLYLNPFNFAIYFALGILLKDNLEKIIDLSTSRRNIIALIFIIMLFITATKNMGGYAGVMTIPFSIISFLSIISIINSKLIEILNIKSIGEFSFTIYLLHMPIAGIINIMCRNILMLNIIKFLLVIAIMKIGINIIFYLSSKMKIFIYLNKLIGIKGKYEIKKIKNEESEFFK